MLVPLGPVFSKEVLGSGTAGFGLLTTALGAGVAVGVLVLSIMQKRVPKERVFTTSVLVAGIALGTAASMSSLPLAMAAVSVLGVCAGSVYVIGFTILHENVRDEMRGRIFATLYTLIRLCLLAALALAPFLSEVLDRVSRSVNGPDRAVSVADLTIGLPGVRLTLWFGALVVLVAGCLAVWSLRRPPSTTEP
jgi:dTMP kinase